MIRVFDFIYDVFATLFNRTKSVLSYATQRRIVNIIVDGCYIVNIPSAQYLIMQMVNVHDIKPIMLFGIVIFYTYSMVILVILFTCFQCKIIGSISQKTMTVIVTALGINAIVAIIGAGATKSAYGITGLVCMIIIVLSTIILTIPRGNKIK